uniref:Uncharacterized protein n=1 Tax=Chenopodium quinoa TaxID=63459 RepID=A0A803KSD5_CHEQI
MSTLREATTSDGQDSQATKSTAQIRMPSDSEIEEFFAAAEKDIQKRFSDKWFSAEYRESMAVFGGVPGKFGYGGCGGFECGFGSRVGFSGGFDRWVVVDSGRPFFGGSWWRPAGVHWG